MSGHSKWANIKNRKGAQDKKRSEAFTKVSKNILTAIRANGGNTHPESNSSLKVAIEKAKEVNMPKENIERLITRFEERKANLADYEFEGFGPFGVPMIVEVETDNKNRILGEIRLIFRDYDGSLGAEGSVNFLFDRVGEIEVKRLPEDKELELIDAGASDFDGEMILTKAMDLKKVAEKAEELGLEVAESELSMRAKQPVILGSEDELDKIMEMIEKLEENDDVINVFAGFDYHE
jgi:YebC/PmpR family DNA-binding regulatory protein